MSQLPIAFRPSANLLRLLAAGFVALLLQLPIFRIAELVGERQMRMESAIEEVTAKSGRRQTINGPVLVVPYARTLSSPDTELGEQGLALLPQRLVVSGTVTSEERRRGIFSIPVYTVDAELSGSFSTEDLAGLDVDPASIDWPRAKLVVGISSVRTLQSMSRLRWGGRQIEFLPGIDTPGSTAEGIHAPLNLSALTREVDFSFPLRLGGSQGLYFLPNGRESRVELAGNSGLASFQGAWLPVSRELTEGSFRASWSVPYLARNYPQAFDKQRPGMAPPTLAFEEQASFGVDLLAPVDAYRMTERSVKYAALFIVLTFALVWLVELRAGRRVHPVQYLFLGAAMCIFYLLELSLAEHLDFGPSYLLASLAIVALCGGYGRAMLGQWRRAGLLGGAMAALYGYLYVVLTNEDHALLVGALGLLAALALVMFATRDIDWFAVGGSLEDRATGPAEPVGSD